MAAPAFGSAGTTRAGSTASPQFAVPSGVAAGDIIVIAFFVDGSTTITSLGAFAHAPASPIANVSDQSHIQNILWKRATGADTGTYDFTLSANSYSAGVALRYTGAASSGVPFDTPGGGDTASAADTENGTVTPAVNITTAGADRLVLFGGTDWAGGAWTPPTGFTERLDANDHVNTFADAVQSVAGNTGSVTATCAGSGKRTGWIGALIPVGAAVAAATPRPFNFTTAAVQRAATW